MTTYTSYYSCPLGQLKLQCSDEYLQAVLFMKEEQQGITDEHPLLEKCLLQLDEYFDGKRKEFELPLLQTGTDFQQKVWHELMNIPFGKTISYQEMSRRLGDPKVIRAAAAANGKNHVAIVVPCHRVIGSNRELVGYGGGLWRKKWLLEHENKIAHGVQTLF